MMKKRMKNLSTLALAVIIGVSAFGSLAHAHESMAYSLSSVSCPWCGSVDVDDLGSSISGYSFYNIDLHQVTVRAEYRCNPCYTEFNEYETYYEGHDYELNMSNNMLECVCGDSYAWSRGISEE